MQDTYISLDPAIANADHNVRKFRNALYRQRRSEAYGGPAAHAVGVQFFITATLCSWATMRSRGLSLSPMNVSKLPQLAAMLGTGFVF